LTVILCCLLFISLASTYTFSIAAISTEPVGWQADSNLTEGLPPLGWIGENHQCFVYNLSGTGKWSLIVAPHNGWTIDQFPFTGYDWDGSQWISNDAIVRGLVAYTNENDPTVGFNVTGEGTFDMIVGGACYSSQLRPVEGRGWIGYSWMGSAWVENSNLITGFPNFNEDGGGNNFASLAYNLNCNGRWNLIVDNYDNKGYMGFEWNGTAWHSQNNLVNGLPLEEALGPECTFPVPAVAQGFEGETVLFVGLAGGVGGRMEGFKWNGESWIADDSYVYGIDSLPPWPNTPTVAFNVTGNNRWVMLIGSASGFVNQTAYYAGYYWTGKSPVILTPLSASVGAGKTAVYTATLTDEFGGTAPYTYQWYVNGHLEFSVNSTSETNSWTFTPTVNMTYYVNFKVVDADGVAAESIKSTLTVSPAISMTLPIAGGPGPEHSPIPQLFLYCRSYTADGIFRLDITGNLSDAGWGLTGQPLTFLYSADGGSSWNPITTVNTGTFGDFIVTWTPPVSGNCLLRADYPGNITYLPISTIVNFETTASGSQPSPVSIQTNSTIAAFSFDAAKKLLSFSFSGPDGSTGYLNVFISRGILADVSDLKVLLDGKPVDFETDSTGYFWVLSLNYPHSSHTVVIDMASNTAETAASNGSSSWVTYGSIVAVAVAVIIGSIVVYLKKLKQQRVD
jgi:hypothetical protein